MKRESGDRFLISPARNLSIKIKSSGYIPKSGLFLANILTDFCVWGMAVLDIGTGEVGLLANCLKKQGAKRVVACDIDEETIRHARIACPDINGVEWVLSDIYSNVPIQNFDLIVSNPPQMPMSQPGHFHDYGGSDGRFVILRIIKDSVGYLKRGGRIVFLCFDFLSVDRRANNQPSLAEIGDDLGLSFYLLASRRNVVRKGGQTEKSLGWINAVYPLYKFQNDEEGNLTYQSQVILFQKRK